MDATGEIDEKLVRKLLEKRRSETRSNLPRLMRPVLVLESVRAAPRSSSGERSRSMRPRI
jgi:hypothetical protein